MFKLVFPPTAAHAEYQQVVPAGDFPLICNISSTHHAEKPINTSECWMVIGWCKKLTRGRQKDQSHGPYISCCSHQNQNNLPCFGSSNSSVAPSLGEFQYNMSSKQPAVIEIPDDDFPDSGPQNPVKAQSYRDQLDAIMSTFSDLLVDDWKDALRSTVTSLKKLMMKHWWQIAEADMDVVLKSVHNPSCVLSASAPHHWRCWCGRASDRCPLGVDFPQAAAQKGTEDGGLGAHCVVLQPPLGSACPHVVIRS